MARGSPGFLQKKYSPAGKTMIPGLTGTPVGVVPEIIIRLPDEGIVVD